MIIMHCISSLKVIKKGGRKTNLTPPLFIEVPVTSQVCERSCICMLAFSTIFLLDFRTVVFIA
jgi:hypothetical protein